MFGIFLGAMCEAVLRLGSGVIRCEELKTFLIHVSVTFNNHTYFLIGSVKLPSRVLSRYNPQPHTLFRLVTHVNESDQAPRNIPNIFGYMDTYPYILFKRYAHTHGSSLHFYALCFELHISETSLHTSPGSFLYHCTRCRPTNNPTNSSLYVSLFLATESITAQIHTGSS